jgi:hypothetical protein
LNLGFPRRTARPKIRNPKEPLISAGRRGWRLKRNYEVRSLPPNPCGPEEGA